MKRFGIRSRIIWLAAIVQWCMLCAGCSLLGEEDSAVGVLRLSFGESTEFSTKAIEPLPDTSDFLLNITDASGRVVFNGKFGDCPEKMEVSAGSYIVRARSEEFDKPAFAKPQYGDEVCVIVPSGGLADVKLSCVQLNSGIQLNIDKSFLCPKFFIHIFCSNSFLCFAI